MITAPEPEVSIVSAEVIKDGKIYYRLTCTIALMQASTVPIEITTKWNVIEKSGNLAQVSGELLSDVKIHTCNHIYSQEMMISESTLSTEATAVSCEAFLSVSSMYVAGTSSRATVAVGSLSGKYYSY